LFFFIVTISIVVTSKKASNDAVWNTVINKSGWPSDGISFCLGFVTPAFALAGTDGVVHMAEETHSPRKNIPRAMIWSILINGAAGFLFVIAILYAITDADAVVSTPTGSPIVEVFLQATRRSPQAATAMTCSVIIVLIMAFFAGMASTSRLTWAFARDKYVSFSAVLSEFWVPSTDIGYSGLPFADYLKQLNPKDKCPTRAVVLTTVIISLFSLINIGSTTAFNALLSLSVIGTYFSYGLPIILFAIRRFDPKRPIVFGPWRLGKFGFAVNLVAIIFCSFLIIFLPFPTVLPVTALNMNYAVVLFAGVMGFAVVYYFTGGKDRYKGPVEVMVE
jgi:choline transport protein